MIIILAVVLSISTILYSEIKVLRNIGNSVVGLYAADSGIEKVLFFDRQVRPANAVRGLCSMYKFDVVNNPNACTEDSTPDNPTVEHSIYCNNQATLKVGTADATNGCDPAVCDDCTISFDTVLDTGITYSTTAVVADNKNFKNFEIDSKGVFGGAGRQIQIVIKTSVTGPDSRNLYNLPSTSLGGPIIDNGLAVCTDNNKITFSADVITTALGASISSVMVFDDNAADDNFSQAGLQLQYQGDQNYSKPWNGAVSGVAYTFKIRAFDDLGNSAEVSLVPITCQ